MSACPACGQENPAGARFCNACGATLASATSAAREERKVVTVLFADLVGFTARAERLDPEDVRALLAAYHTTLRRELERHGGTVEKFVGDAVMALFGAPVAHEDDPERAVRAALSIRDEVADLARAQDRDLHIRVGITTGEALVDLAARPQAGEGMASGDVVNTAARLQTAAPVDGVLVDEATHRATDRVIAYRVTASVPAKGKADPVEAWEVVEARARLGTDVPRTATAPLVGRGHEVDVLRGALGRSRREGSPQLVTLVAEELEASALHNLGTARGNVGEAEGMRDIERGLEIALRAAPAEATRGYLNLASTSGAFGDIRRCTELHERGLELAERIGENRGARFLRGDMSVDRLMLGEWDGALALANPFIAEVEAGNPHYMESPCRIVRAMIAVARDAVADAVADIERALEQARQLGEPQALFPALANGAWVLLDTGRTDAARALLEELLSTRANEAGWWAIPAVVPMEQLGLVDAVPPLLEPMVGKWPWADAAVDYARGRFSEAAARLDEIGDLTTAAAAWMRAAEALAAGGRRPEAGRELERALAFYRGVRATRYVRRGEALLAA